MIETLHSLTTMVLSLALLFLVLFAIGSVFLFLRVFKSDFDLPD